MSGNNLDRVKENQDFLIKQSEMLQAVIKRMADNSLEVKKFGLTAWAAIVGFGFTNRNPDLFKLAFILFILFGLLDVYYLYYERKFRDNFNRLVRIINHYASSDDEQWINKKQGNFLKPDVSRNFLEPGTFLRELPNTLKSWANLPYLITFVITILLLNIPLPSK